MANIKLHLLVLVLSIKLLIASSLGHPPPEYAALFVFGDSFYDAGNNNYINTTTGAQANFPPYGLSYFKYPTGRFCDGRLVSDFIAQYAKLPLIKPYLEPGFIDYSKGVNFASAGAGALVETNRGLVIDLGTQVKHFMQVAKVLRKKLGQSEAETLLSRSVYLLHIGPNDYGVSYLTNSSILRSYSKEYIRMVIGNVTEAIKEIHMLGGRKFGLLNLGPYGCVPVYRALLSGDACVEDLNVILHLHNKALYEALQYLEHHLEGFKYSIFNGHKFFSERINNPSKYGFKEVKSACCGSGPFRGYSSCGGKRGIKYYELCDDAYDYMFFDFAHPTEKTFKQFAELMWSGDAQYSWPYNVKTLFKLQEV